MYHWTLTPQLAVETLLLCCKELQVHAEYAECFWNGKALMALQKLSETPLTDRVLPNVRSHTCTNLGQQLDHPEEINSAVAALARAPLPLHSTSHRGLPW